MALSDTSKTLISIKKLVGKAHTSNDKDVANEALPTGLTVSSNTVLENRYLEQQIKQIMRYMQY